VAGRTLRRVSGPVTWKPRASSCAAAPGVRTTATRHTSGGTAGRSWSARAVPWPWCGGQAAHGPTAQAVCPARADRGVVGGLPGVDRPPGPQRPAGVDAGGDQERQAREQVHRAAGVRLGRGSHVGQEQPGRNVGGPDTTCRPLGQGNDGGEGLGRAGPDHHDCRPVPPGRDPTGEHGGGQQRQLHRHRRRHRSHVGESGGPVPVERAGGHPRRPGRIPPPGAASLSAPRPPSGRRRRPGGRGRPGERWVTGTRSAADTDRRGSTLALRPPGSPRAGRTPLTAGGTGQAQTGRQDRTRVQSSGIRGRRHLPGGWARVGIDTQVVQQVRGPDPHGPLEPQDPHRERAVTDHRVGQAAADPQDAARSQPITGHTQRPDLLHRPDPTRPSPGRPHGIRARRQHLHCVHHGVMTSRNNIATSTDVSDTTRRAPGGRARICGRAQRPAGRPRCLPALASRYPAAAGKGCTLTGPTPALGNARTPDGPRGAGTEKTPCGMSPILECPRSASAVGRREPPQGRGFHRAAGGLRGVGGGDG
jgi:hypothetical protein